MNPFFKILILLLMGLPVSQMANAQTSNWTQENWQVASGQQEGFKPANQFQTQFPKTDAQTRPAFPVQSPVQHADFNSEIDEFSGLPDTSEGTLDESASWENSPDNWSSSIHDQFKSIQWQKVVSSLAIVLGAFFGFIWLTRRINPSGNAGIPDEVFELVGTTRLNAKQNLQLVRLGSKLLLLVNGEGGTHTIAEITDPEEVEYLSGLCREKSKSRNQGSRGLSGSATMFRRALDRTRDEGRNTEAALDKVIRKLTELAGKSKRTDYEA